MQTTQPYSSSKYRRCYQLLKRTGHSPTHALGILIDAKRKQEFALYWIKMVFRTRHGSGSRA